MVNKAKFSRSSKSDKSFRVSKRTLLNKEKRHPETWGKGMPRLI